MNVACQIVCWESLIGYLNCALDSLKHYPYVMRDSEKGETLQDSYRKLGKYF